MLKFDFLLILHKVFTKITNFLCKNRLFCEFYQNYKRAKKDNTRKQELIPVLKELYETKPYPLPVAIEIETLNRCNGDCDFCPVNKNADKREFKIMDETLFYSIIAQLKEINYKGFISVYSNNEPLLDERIFDFVKYVKQELPEAKKFLFTNGLLLNLEKFKILVENLDFLIIDHYFEGKLKLRENILNIGKYILEHPELKTKVKIQPINKHKIRNNRAGNAKNRSNFYKIQASCLWPFSQMVIRPTGQISLCCNDALGQATMGDLNNEKLIDVWRSEKYAALRKSMLETRAGVEICQNCDSFGLLNRNNILLTYKIGENWDEIEELIKK